MKYESTTKPITIANLMAEGGDCDDFKTNLNIFINMDIKTRPLNLWKELYIEDIVPCFRMYPAWKEWLIEKGFIKPVISHHIGQIFTACAFSNRAYLIVGISSHKIGLVGFSPFDSSHSTLKFKTEIEVDDPWNITYEEFRSLMNPVLGSQWLNLKEVKLEIKEII